MIRKAKFCDIPDLVMLNSQVQDIHVKLFPEVFKTGDTHLIGEWFSEVLSSDDYCVFVALENDVSVGYMTVRKLIKPERPFKKGIRCAYIDQVCIHPDHRRMGIFKALLKGAEEEAVSWGMNRLELDVWTENSNAVKSFEKSGFTTFNQKMFLLLNQ